jgi:hypothetical protein
MKIIRYQDPQGQIHFAAEQPDGSVWRIQKDFAGTGRKRRRSGRIRCQVENGERYVLDYKASTLAIRHVSCYRHELR